MLEVYKDLQIEVIKYLLEHGETIYSISRKLKCITYITLERYLKTKRRPSDNKYYSINNALKQTFKFEYDVALEEILKKNNCYDLDSYLKKKYKLRYHIGE